MNLDPEKFYDAPAPDQETRDEEAADEVDDALAELQARPNLEESSTEGDPTMTKLERSDRLEKPEPEKPQAEKPELVKSEPVKPEPDKPEPIKPQPVKALRIDFDETTGVATAVPLTVDGKVAQDADGKDLEKLPDGATPLSWSASSPGVVVTPNVGAGNVGLTAKVSAAVPAIKVMGETVAATCQVPQPDKSILTIGGTSQPFEVILDETGKPESKFKLH